MYPCLLSINCGIYYFNIDRPRFSIKNKEVIYGKYGESTKLEFYIYSFSANVNDVFLKSQEGTLCPIKRLNIIVEKIMVIFFKRFIHVNGYRITFETKVLTDLDFRKYKIIVENNYGEGVFNFTLQSACKYICNYKQYIEIPATMYVTLNVLIPILIYMYCEGQMKQNVI
jgi:hypothetical protein